MPASDNLRRFQLAEFGIINQLPLAQIASRFALIIAAFSTATCECLKTVHKYSLHAEAERFAADATKHRVCILMQRRVFTFK